MDFLLTDRGCTTNSEKIKFCVVVLRTLDRSYGRQNAIKLVPSKYVILTHKLYWKMMRREGLTLTLEKKLKKSFRFLEHVWVTAIFPDYES